MADLFINAVNQGSGFLPIHVAALGDVTFTASADHATVISYEARARTQTDGVLTGTKPLGKPSPRHDQTIIINLFHFLSALPADNYTVSIAATDAGGTTESAVSNAFTVPLS